MDDSSNIMDNQLKMILKRKNDLILENIKLIIESSNLKKIIRKELNEKEKEEEKMEMLIFLLNNNNLFINFNKN